MDLSSYGNFVRPRTKGSYFTDGVLWGVPIKWLLSQMLVVHLWCKCSSLDIQVMWSRMKCCYIEVSSWQIFVWCGVFDKQIFISGLMVVHEMMVANIKSWRIDFENGFSLEGTWPKMEIIWSLLALSYILMRFPLD
jgi:hypothetical protein